MPVLDRLDVSPFGYLLVAALLALLLVLSAWLDGAPRRHAPNAAAVSGVGLVAGVAVATGAGGRAVGAAVMAGLGDPAEGNGCAATTRRSTSWRSAPTARCWPAAATIARRGCSTSRPVRRSARGPCSA